MSQSSPRLFGRGSWSEDSRVAGLLRQETVGGALLLAGSVVALVWANSPWGDSYEALRDLRVGPSALHLDLSLGTWAADGLLAIFFFVVGLELKREFVAGDLRDPRRAALPILAAVGGMVAPAIVYVVVNVTATGADTEGALRGWAIPTATDIAFALAVLAVISTHLPTGLRTFLLTLAVVDDLLAVMIIAVFYTSDLKLWALAAALVPIAIFAVLVQRRITAPWLLVPLAVIAWVAMHESGVHATVAGVLLGFTVPVLTRDGVVLGKFVGVFGTTYLLARFTRAQLDGELSWIDVAGLALLAGICFTVSLLIGELAFEEDHLRHEHVKVGVLAGSLVSAVLASVLLRARNRVYRHIEEQETRDENRDDIPDVYQRGEDA